MREWHRLGAEMAKSFLVCCRWGSGRPRVDSNNDVNTSDSCKRIDLTLHVAKCLTKVNLDQILFLVFDSRDLGTPPLLTLSWQSHSFKPKFHPHRAS
jgi:hypothetical protein